MLLLVALGALTNYMVLTKDALLPGIDAPYYLVQVRSLLQDGRLAYGDPPLTFLLFSGVALLLQNIVLGVVLGDALLSALAVVPLYLLMKKVTQHELAAIAAGIAFTFSFQHLRMMADLMKNAVGLLFLLGFLYYLHDLTLHRRTRANLLGAAGFLLLTGLTHVLDLGVALLFLVLYPLVALLSPRNKLGLLKDLAPLFVLVGLFAAAGLLLLPTFFTDFYKGLFFLEDVFEDQPTQPFLGPPGTSAWSFLPFTLVGTLWVVRDWRRQQYGSLLLTATTTIIGTALSLPFIPPTWLWRFVLMQFVPASIIIGLSIAKIPERFTATVLLVLVASPILLQAGQSLPTIRPSISLATYRDLEAFHNKVNSDAVAVVPFKGLAYWVEYVDEVATTGRFTPSLFNTYDQVFIVVEKARRLPVPPGASLLYDGATLVLYQVPKR